MLLATAAAPTLILVLCRKAGQSRVEYRGKNVKLHLLTRGELPLTPRPADRVPPPEFFSALYPWHAS